MLFTALYSHVICVFSKFMKSIPLVTILVTSILVLAGMPTAQADSSVAEKVTELYLKAREENQLIPQATELEPNLTLSEAYGIQRVFVSKLLEGDRIAGFKAGVTNEPAQAKLELEEPLAGVLLGSMDLSGQLRADKDDYRLLKLEVEVAFMVGKTINKPLKNIGELKSRILSVRPAIELPDSGFSKKIKFTGKDVAAANVAAAGFILGASRGFEGMDLESLNVVLTRDDETVIEGVGSETMGSPWNAALWLVNSMVKQGYKLEPGQVLMTGALGGAKVAEPGVYRADFGELGRIMFEIQ